MATIEQYPEQAEVYAPRYDLTANEAHLLCTDFLNSQEEVPQTALGCYIVDGSDRYSDLARFVEGSVFLETFGNTPDDLAAEYGPYEPASQMIIVIDHEAQMPVGVLRTIHNSDAGLKSLADLERTELGVTGDQVCRELDIDPQRCVDVGTLAIAPEYRGSAGQVLPSLLLYRSLYLKYLNHPDFDHVVTIIDKKAEKNLFKLNFPFRPIRDEYFNYIDSKKSRALYGVNQEFYPSVSRRQQELAQQAEAEQSDAKNWYAIMLDGLAHGTGLDEMLAFPKE